MRAPLLPLVLLAAGLGALGGLTGCSLFPRHEEVWTPIPTRLGERRVAGADTSWVLAAPAYELVVRDREWLPDAKQELDLALQAWRRHLGGEPGPAAVFIVDSLDLLSAADTLSWRERGYRIAVAVVPPRRRGDPPRPGLIAPWVARAWLDARAGDGAELPAWLREGAAALVGEPALASYAPAFLAQERKRMLPLDTLVRRELPRPRPPRRFERPRRFARVDSTVVARGEAVAFLQFLTSREGTGVVGRLVDAARAGGTSSTPAALLAAVGVEPADPAALERPWREWLTRQAEDLGVRNPRFVDAED